MFGFKKEADPIEEVKKELAQAWVDAETEEEKNALIDRYLELDTHQIEREKVLGEHKIDSKTWLNTGVTVGLALLTLNFERFDVLRSKVTSLWLKRREK